MVERLGVWFAFLPLGIISANVGNAENIGLRNYGTGDNPVNFFIAIAANSVKQYTASFLTCSCFITRCLAQIRNSEFWPEWLRLSDELRRAYDMIKSFDFVRDWLLGPFTNNARVQENLDACFFEGKKKSTPKSIVYFFLQKQFSSAHSWNTHCYLITKCDLSICTIEKSVIYYKIIDFKIHSISLCTFKISQNGHHHFNKKINLQSCTFPLYKGVTRLTTSLQETGSTWAQQRVPNYQTASSDGWENSQNGDEQGMFSLSNRHLKNKEILLRHNIRQKSLITTPT